MPNKKRLEEFTFSSHILNCVKKGRGNLKLYIWDRYEYGKQILSTYTSKPAEYSYILWV